MNFNPEEIISLINGHSGFNSDFSIPAGCFGARKAGMEIRNELKSGIEPLIQTLLAGWLQSEIRFLSPCWDNY